jgi:hypothetical protein
MYAEAITRMIRSFTVIAVAGFLLSGPILAQDTSSFDTEEGEDVIAGIPRISPGQAATPQPGAMECFARAAKKRMTFAVANLFDSRDVFRGINWFGTAPAYLLGGDFKLDVTPYDEQRLRDIWEAKLHTFVGGAWALKRGHEINDRYKVTEALENRFFKYLDFDIGYEHYGLPPFDNHDRDFEELLLRAGINSIPTFRPLTLPGFAKPVEAIPFSVHYGAYSAFSTKKFAFTNDEFGVHGYPNNWWWHNVEFNLIVPFPDAIPDTTWGILQCLKLDSTLWMIDQPSVLPGLKSGLQDAEFGLALPLILDMGKAFALENRLCGFFGESKIILEPYVRYVLDAQNIDPETKIWHDTDEVIGGAAIVYTF